jgi:hypothetical protein
MAMTARAHTPVQDAYRPLSPPTESILLNRGYSVRSGSRPNSFVASNSGYNYAHGAVVDPPSNVRNPRFNEEFDLASQRGSVVLNGPSAPGVQRSASQMSHSSSATPARSTTLKKKSSLSKKGSMRRSGSRRSLRAGSVRSLVLGDKEKYGVDGADDQHSAFYVPIPTNGNPTEVMAQRFQGMYPLRNSISMANDMLMHSSLAQGLERPYRLFQGSPEVLRDPVKTLPVGVECSK